MSDQRKWLWRLAFGSVGCLTLITVGLVLLGIRGCPRPGTPTHLGARLLPAHEASSAGEIDALDFVVDGDRTMHMVWILRLRDRPPLNAKSQQVWYRRGDLETNTWGRPRLLDDDAKGPPRIIRVGDTLHVVVPYELKHYLSGDSGTTWTESTPLLHPLAYIATRPQVAADGDSLIVAYGARERTGQGGYELGPTAVLVTAWGRGVLGSTRILLESPDWRSMNNAQLRLAVSRGSVMSTSQSIA